MELAECPNCRYIMKANKIKIDLLKYDSGMESICTNCKTSFVTLIKEDNKKYIMSVIG